MSDGQALQPSSIEKDKTAHWCQERVLETAGARRRKPQGTKPIEEPLWELLSGVPAPCPPLVARPCPRPTTTTTHDKWSKVVLMSAPVRAVRRASSETCFFCAGRRDCYAHSSGALGSTLGRAHPYFPSHRCYTPKKEKKEKRKKEITMIEFFLVQTNQLSGSDSK